MLRVLDPVAETRPAERTRPARVLEALEGLRVGFLWGGHAATVQFWPRLEQAVENLFRPRSIRRLYKRSTWNVASPGEIEAFAREIDYVVVGVGA